MEWHAIKKEEVVRHLKSSYEGLSSREVEKRLGEFGKNEIKEILKINPLKILLKQLNSFLIYVMLFAVLISVLIKHYLDASVISAIILFNAAIGFIQQYKAEKSILKLRQLFVPKVKVFRDQKLLIVSSQELVPGDVMLLEEGDKVLADSRILESDNLEINEAILTGESNAVEKYDTIISHDGLISEKVNMLFSGTSVVKGKAKAIIVSTGMSTEFGKIAEKLQEISLAETPLQKNLDKFAKKISFIAIMLAVAVFLIGILNGGERTEMFLTSIALIVSAIPEGLPAVITVSLAIATNKMLRNNVLIRRLPAAETLGSVTVICSDKTGTITKEMMSVVSIFCDNKFYKETARGIFSGKKEADISEERELYSLVKTSVLASNARFEKISDKEYQVIGDSTESALVSLAIDLGMDKRILTEQEPRVKEISFSSERKMMSILRKSDRRNVLYCKGSASSILSKSSFEIRNNQLVQLSKKRIRELEVIAESMERQGLRVMAFASKFVSSEKNLEEGLTFIGLMGLIDPPREEVRDAIKLCREAGIKVKIITGDSILTAKTIGQEIGIQGKIIGGREMNDMSDNELLEQIDDISIFARIEPRQKLRIVEILMKKGEQVAITGDGVNDILALKRADIGIAMGKRGSDVAREVSDMILLDDNFSSIVKGIEEGRVVYDNTKKATKFLVASNFGEILLIISSILFRLPLPLLPLQILWINLITDSIPALALTKEQGEQVMRSKPRKEDSILKGVFLPSLFASIILLVSSFLLFYFCLSHFSIEKTRTLVMLSIVGFETLFTFTCRSEKPLSEIGFFSNKYIIYAVLLVFIVQAVLILTPLSSLFGLTNISLPEFLLVVLASLPGLLIFEAWKYIKKK
jgi:Ca2+-transporting ATPase